MLRSVTARASLLLPALLLAAFAGLVVISATTEARAQDASTTKKSRKKKGKKKKVRDEDAAEGASREDEKPAAEPAGPEDAALKRQGAASLKMDTALDRKAIERTQLADQKRDEAIDDLKQLIPKAPASQKAEMIFRLAELYWEKSKYRNGLEMNAFEKAYNRWAEGGRSGREPQQKDFVRESELIKQNALKLYERVLTDYPTYERNDEVLFYLGYNEYDAAATEKSKEAAENRRNVAIGHYWTLIKQFPQSRLVPDAYLQLGEHFFNKNDVEKARKAYERALASSPPRIYNYALYKLAWCDYNIQEYQDGIKKLKDVIDRSDKATKSNDPVVQLKGEALGDLARFFSYVDEVDTAFDYFRAKGGEDLAVRYTTRLGSLFDEQGKWPLAIKTYRMLNDRYPMNPKAPELQSLIVKAYSRLNKKDSVRKEVERLVDMYRPGTPWYAEQKKKGDKAALEYAYDLTESNLRDLVTEYHADAQKRQDIATYQLARDIYRKYLDAFSDTESAYEMRFYYAEVLWALKEWKNAAEQYEVVARTDEGGKPESGRGKSKNKAGSGKYARTAAFDAILAWEKISTEGEKGELSEGKKISEKDKKPGPDRTVTHIRATKLAKDKQYVEEPVPENEKKLSEACDFYFKIAEAKDPDLPAIKFKAAYIFYKHNHFVEAAERYNEIIKRWPQDELAKKSANLILDSLNVQEKWEELERYAREFKDNRRLAGNDKKFIEETQGLIEGATFNAILAAEKKAREAQDEEAKRGALAKVATRFRTFQREFADSKYAAKAVYNALNIYDQADELDRAIEAAELLVKKYDDSELAEKASFLLAGFYERIADFETAADLYARFYDKHRSSKSAADALYNAGVYYQGLGYAKKAIERFETYTQEFADRDDAADVYWRTCEIREEEKQWKQVVECFGKFRDKYRKAAPAKVYESRYRLALAYEQQKQHPQALGEYKSLVSGYAKLSAKDRDTPGARLAVAHAAFELLDPEYAEYMRMRVTLNKRTLTAKINKAEELACVPGGEKSCKRSGKFLGVLEYKNGDYGIAALTRIGQVYRGMADAIRGAPLPPRLDEDQIEIYKQELDNVAMGPQEKAVEAFENALKKAYELNIYNRWTLEAQSNLKDLSPDRFPDQQKREPRGAEEFVIASVRDVRDTPRSEPPPAAEPARAKPARPAAKGGGGDDEDDEGGDDGEDKGAGE